MLMEIIAFGILTLSPNVLAVIVQTKLGKIRGLEQQLTQGEFLYQFRKIPYAKPPVGSRRFSKPEAYGSWPGTLNGIFYGPSCSQNFAYSPVPLPNYVISEDCLFLNIYVPFDIKPSSNRSVMVWIHGGGMTSGQGMLYDGSFLAVHGNVIVVTINYRLGVLGFFTNGDSDIPGNYGLWDQKLALEWVHQNIESFGGNPNSVTIFGGSSGSFCVSLLSLSPVVSGLFQRVIAQSRSAFSPSFFAAPFMIKGVSEVFVEVLGCQNSTNNTELLECLRNVPAEDLLHNQGILGKSIIAIDGDMVPDYPINLLSNKSSISYSLYRSRDYMTGFNSAEGSSLISEWITPSIETKYNFTIKSGIPNTVLCDFLVPTMTLNFFANSFDVEKKICEKYTDNRSIGAQGKRIENLLGDVYSYSPIIQMLDIHSYENIGAKSFQYIFTSSVYRRKLADSGYPWLTGAYHGDEIMLLFGFTNYSQSLTSSEEKFVDLMMGYWSNFAKYGDPNDKTLPVWPEYGRQEEYIILDENMKENKQDYLEFQNTSKFWSEEIPKLITTNEPIISKTSKSDTSSLISNVLFNVIAAYASFTSTSLSV